MRLELVYDSMIAVFLKILTRYQDHLPLNAPRIAAAKKIQKVYRGHQGRKHAQNVRRERARAAELAE